MAVCQRCEKSGILVRVDAHGVCRSCRRTMGADAEKRAEKIREAAEFVERGPLEARLARCEAILEHAAILRAYGELGVWVEDLDPGVVMSRYGATKREIVHAALSEAVEGASGRAAEATNPNMRRGALERGLEKIESLKPWLDEPDEARSYENELADRIARLVDSQLKSSE